MTKNAMMNSNTFTNDGTLIIGIMIEMSKRPVISRLFFINLQSDVDVSQIL
jgi:hypothetical protein